MNASANLDGLIARGRVAFARAVLLRERARALLAAVPVLTALPARSAPANELALPPPRHFPLPPPSSEAPLSARAEPARPRPQPSSSTDSLHFLLFDRAPFAYVRTDRSGVIREANQAAGRFLGMPAARLVDRPLLNFVPRGDTAAFRAMVKRLGDIATEEQVQARFRPRGQPVLGANVSIIRLTRGAFGWVLRPL